MKRIFVIGLVLIFVFVGFIGCSIDTPEDLEDQTESSASHRVKTFSMAEKKYPMPITTNFPAREVLVDYTERQDMVNHPWYVYVMSDLGTITHYFVSKSPPVSTNAFLSSTESIYKGWDNDLILTAPSLDGIYYGGSGSVSTNNGMILVDVATDGMFIIYGHKLIVSDVPLLLETEPLLIQGASQ